MHSVGRCGMCSAVLCGSSICRRPECHSRVSGPYRLLALNVLGARDVENGAPFDLWETFGKFSEGLLSILSSHPFLDSRVIVFGLATAMAFMKSLHSAYAILMHPAVMLPQ